jgi:hypothetical protein
MHVYDDVSAPIFYSLQLIAQVLCLEVVPDNLGITTFSSMQQAGTTTKHINTARCFLQADEPETSECDVRTMNFHRRHCWTNMRSVRQATGPIFVMDRRRMDGDGRGAAHMRQTDGGDVVGSTWSSGKREPRTERGCFAPGPVPCKSCFRLVIVAALLKIEIISTSSLLKAGSTWI